MTDAQDKKMIHPTLMVGLGGSGKLILTHIKARLIEESRCTGQDLLQFPRLSVLDIDGNEPVVHLSDGTPVTLDRDREFVDLGQVPVGDARHQLDSGSFSDSLQSWFSQSTSLREEQIRRGGQQIRQLGRLHLFHHLDRGQNIYGYLEQAVRQVVDVANAARSQGQNEMSPNPPPSINVYIISSLAGGTGSGMFIDAAYILQDLFRNHFQLNPVKFTGILVMASVFRNVPSSKLGPNTLAALRELEFFQTQDRLPLPQIN